MPISGSQPAFTYARLGVMRLGGSRLDYYQPVLKFLIDGVSDGRVLIEGLSIEDLLNGTPNRATMRLMGVVPVAGQEIRIALGELDSAHYVFAGHIVEVSQIYLADNPLNPDNVAYDIQATSYEYRLNADRMTTSFLSQSATATLVSIINGFGDGFSTAKIQAGLPVIPELTFIDARITDAIDEVMNRVGGSWYVDYGLRVHAFLAADEEAHDIEDGSVHGAREIVKTTDITQARNRITVRGAGSRVTAALAAGVTVIPLQDVTAFATGGGSAFHAVQEFTYGGKVAGGVGSNVEGMAGPVSAPSVAIGSGIGGVVGVVSYKVAFKNSQGETIPGPASSNVTGVVVTAPAGAPTVSLASGIGRMAGAYTYRTTFVTSRGETTLGGTSLTVTPVAVAAPTAPSVALLSGIGRLVGAYGYKVTYVTALGETLASSAGSRTAVAIAAPTAPSLAAVSSTIGPLIGAYNYRLTYVTPLGETAGGTVASRTATAQSAPSAPTIGTHTVNGPLIGTYRYKVGFVSAIGETLGTATGTTSPVATQSSQPLVFGDGTGLEIAYATTYVHPVHGESALSSRRVDTNKATNPVVEVQNLPSGCGWNVYSTGTVTAGTGGTAPLFKVAEMGVGTSSFTHTNQTGPALDDIVASMGKNVPLTSIPTGPTGTLARRIYRTKDGGSTYYLVGEIGDNATTTFTDNVPDDSLTVPAPIQNLNGQQHSVTSIPSGPTGTLVKRLYRTTAGGSEYRLLAELANATTSFTDAVADASLGAANPPASSTAGGEKHTVTIPTGPSGTLARRIYRTDAGGTIYRQLVEVAGNVATTYDDDVADSALGPGTEPLQSTAGGQNVDVSGIPTGPAGTTARRLYRTKAGGSEYFLVEQIPGNVTTTYADSHRDEELTGPAPSVNTAGASLVSLTSIPTGPAGITSRLLYRTKAGGSEYFLLARLGDNSTTTYSDSAEDSDLHELAPTVSTIGGLAGDVSLKLLSVASFPASGWARADSQLIRYTGISGTTLTGIPASGTGALVAAVSAGSAILVEPHLTGVAGVSRAIPEGEDVRIFVRLNDAAAQSAYAAATGVGDGVLEEAFDESGMSVTEATDFGEAQLALLKDPLVTMRYVTRDQTTRTGRTVTFDLGAPTNMAGTFLIQSVVLDSFSADGTHFPRRTVQAGSRRFSLEAILRLVRTA